MARGAAAWLAAQGAALPDRDDQSALLGFHHRYAQPLANAVHERRGRLAARAVTLLDRTEAARRPVRLLGVSVHNLEDPSVSFTADDSRLPF